MYIMYANASNNTTYNLMLVHTWYEELSPAPKSFGHTITKQLWAMGI
jgi:hypothetical protein